MSMTIYALRNLTGAFPSAGRLFLCPSLGHGFEVRSTANCNGDSGEGPIRPDGQQAQVVFCFSFAWEELRTRGLLPNWDFKRMRQAEKVMSLTSIPKLLGAILSISISTWLRLPNREVGRREVPIRYCRLSI